MLKEAMSERHKEGMVSQIMENQAANHREYGIKAA